jgi:PAS domain-containing protein
MEVSKHEFARTDDRHEFDAHVFPDYTVQVDMNRKYVDASNSFCSVLGYSRKELIGERFDEVSAPRTMTYQLYLLFLRKRYAHGIWILLNRSHSTRIVVRYEACCARIPELSAIWNCWAREPRKLRDLMSIVFICRY